VPLVSVVIPTFNRAKDLERALCSVLAQTYTNWEVLIVDNHSEDNTDEVIRDLNESRITLFKIHNHGVIAASRNWGIRHARGKYIAFLDSDDWWTENKLSKSVQYLENGADVVYHSLWIVQKKFQKNYQRTRTRQLKNPVFKDLLLNGNVIANSSLVVKKEILKKIGPISEDSGFLAIEDYDAWLKIAGITEKFKLIPETLGYYWAGGGNTSSPQRTIDCLNNFEKNYGNKIYQLNGSKGAWWINYAKSKIYFKLGYYQKAFQFVKEIQLSKVAEHFLEKSKTYFYPRH
jgi:glycosyltransferase involved in cell wall biosynthesis